MPYRQLIFIGTSLLCESSRESLERTKELAHPPTGRAFYCPHCAEVWARGMVMKADGTFFRSDIDVRACEKHSVEYGTDLCFNPPGSILISWDGWWNSALPREALHRELLLSFQYEYLQPEGGWCVPTFNQQR